MTGATLHHEFGHCLIWFPPYGSGGRVCNMSAASCCPRDASPVSACADRRRRLQVFAVEVLEFAKGHDQFSFLAFTNPVRIVCINWRLVVVADTDPMRSEIGRRPAPGAFQSGSTAIFKSWY